MPTVDEALAPVAGSQLTLRDGLALEVEHAGEAEPVERAGLQHDHRLDHPDFTQRGAAGHRVGVLVRRDRLRAHPNPGPLLRQRPATRQAQQDQADLEAGQSDSAAARTGATAARRKSRFMRVMVSMLIILGHASWHSP